MYRYDEFDHAFVHERVAQFREQVERRLLGKLTEDEFRPLRLRNGLYLQLHAYMLRIAIPYGVLSPRQLRQLAMIGRRWDRGYGHFTTRQNLQFNWVKLVDVPDILSALAEVEMHCIQTSGNCVRNVTADPFAGAAHDELEDPRPWCEILRQWSTLHPEFSWLPRKFKIAISGAAEDRAAIAFHDIGLKIVRGPDGKNGFRVFVGGGMGRTPYVGQEICPVLAKEHLLSYIESILRVYNLHGRRDNLNKARIKILVNQLGIDKFRADVEADWEATRKDAIDLPEDERRRIMSYFAPPDLSPRPIRDEAVDQRRITDPVFANWLKHNVRPHQVPGYASVVISLKEPGRTPGDASSDQMDFAADLAERYSRNEARVNYTQNLILPHVARSDLVSVYEELKAEGLATGNYDLLGDMICCPGLDYCNLANARSIPIAKEIAKRFEDPARQELIGPLRLNMSGCINACGHHHSGNIGILGVDKKGTELYQISLGGSPKDDAAVGTIIGPGFRAEAVPQAIDTIISTYLANRNDGEDFLATWRRVGAEPLA
jgi:sulfite reductase (NADPH) hemoprotein beta-component